MPEADRELRRLVISQAGRRLPGERELAVRLGIGRMPLRTLLARLEGEGLLHRRHGSGTWAIASGGARRIVLAIDAGIRLAEDPFFARLAEGLSRRLQQAGREVRQLAWTPEAGVPEADGLIVLGHACARRLSRVRLDDQAAGRAAVTWLRARGCRRLVVVGHERFASPRDRLAGVREGCTATRTRLATFDCGLNLADGLAAAQRLPVCDGVIALNDWCAAGLAAGLRGRDLPIVGFDGLPVAAGLGVHSFAVPIDAIAADLVGELDRLAGSPVAPGRTLLYQLSEPA